MNSHDDDLKALEKLLCIRDQTGRPALSIGLVATLFFENGWTRPVRELVSELGEHYFQLFREQLRWTEHPTSARIYPITSKRVKHHTEWLPGHEEGAAWWFGYHSGESAEAAPPYQVDAFSPDNVRKDAAGYFHIHLPLDYFATRGGTLPEFVRPICERLKPISGYAGIGVIDPGNASADFHPVVRQLGERFPGLEIESNPVTCNHVTDGIKGVNWLTMLSDRWVHELGGLDYLRMRLDEPTFPFYRYDGGIIIQAGPRPQIGDATRNLWPQHYVTLARVLKKVQIKEHFPFHVGTPGITGKMDHAATKAWIFRFDGK